ncbi:MAG: adenylyl-sulfate kinase [Halobacteriota archaeon]|nr:adenylyl-sulfate kinase [Halobacteriota archaeon]
MICHSPSKIDTMSWVIWVTGLPGCGKTTVSERARELLLEKNINVKILQLDKIRKVITPNPKYSEEERDIVYSALSYMALLLYEEGINVIIDATANRRRYRNLARDLISDFSEIYLICSLESCVKREEKRSAEYAPKDIYKRSKSKEASVPGVNVAYEEPESPELVIDSEVLGIDESAALAVNWIINNLQF